MGLYVSTLTESSSGPQDTDPSNNVRVETCSPIPMLIGHINKYTVVFRLIHFNTPFCIT
jgi:hypothetical protein